MRHEGEAGGRVSETQVVMPCPMAAEEQAMDRALGAVGGGASPPVSDDEAGRLSLPPSPESPAPEGKRKAETEPPSCVACGVVWFERGAGAGSRGAWGRRRAGAWPQRFSYASACLTPFFHRPAAARRVPHRFRRRPRSRPTSVRPESASETGRGTSANIRVTIPCLCRFQGRDGSAY